MPAAKDASYRDDPDNLAFNELIEILAGFGISQQQVAKRLGVTPGQVTRVRSGERHCSPKHVGKLRGLLREQKKAVAKQQSGESWSARRPPAHSAFHIDNAVLNGLSPERAVHAFRYLLWARTAELGLATTRVHISLNTFAPDGGIDASVDDLSPSPNETLLDGGTRFQIKTGDFEAWQPAKMETELFGKKTPAFDNLGAGVQAALKCDSRYVLVCFGVDPTDAQLSAAKKNIKDLFSKCGFPRARIDVWGQCQLAGLLNLYPSLCLRLRGHDHQGFRSHLLWSEADDMQPAIQYGPEQYQLIDELRSQIVSGQFAHIRLTGEPGVGKSRLALEVTRAEQLAPSTLYTDSNTVLKSSFINELIQPDDKRFVVLVVDECPYRERAELWNILKPHASHIRLITIDHGPDDSVDDKTRHIEFVGVGDEQIIAILVAHGIELNEARRWAKYCSGCPRVAHVLGDNLRMNREDLLKPPGTVDVWNRFIVGGDAPSSEEVTARKVVLRHIALFEKFGARKPVEKEAEFIAALAKKCHPGLTLGHFHSILQSLKDRRILQGNATLYITPRLLHIELYRAFWKNYGATFDIASAVSQMPTELWDWFVRMLRYAHDVPAAEHAIDTLLQSAELFPDGTFPNRGESGRIIEVLSEASPKAVLRCLRRSIGIMNVESLKRLSEPRQQLVWALEKIAVRREHFVEAAELLLKLAEAENSTNSNNATGTFQQLFSLNPGLAATEAEPSRRLIVLQEALGSQSPTQRAIGLQACAKALNRQTDYRMIGPEYQGLRKPFEFWIPETYGELWKAYEDVWRLLVSKRDTWEGNDRVLLNQTLISSAWSAIHVPPMTTQVVQTLSAIASDPTADISAIVEFIKRQLRYTDEDKLSESVRTDLNALCDSLDGNDFSSRLRRFVKFTTWEDFHDDFNKDTTKVSRIWDELADHAVGNVEDLQTELPWLVKEHSNSAYTFAFRLSQRDTSGKVFDAILGRCRDESECETIFLAGYLAAIFNRDIDEWERTVTPLADNPGLSTRFSDVVIASGLSDETAKHVTKHCREGKQKVERLERWWISSGVKKLDQAVVEDLISLHLENANGELWANAVRIAHSYFMDGDIARPLPESLLCKLLLHEALSSRHATHSAGYYWSRLASAFIDQFPNRKWEFFTGILRAGSREWSALGNLNTQGESLLTDMLRSDPEKAFGCIAIVFQEGRELRNFSLRHWLSQGGPRVIGDESPGPIQHIPSKSLFEWVDGNFDERCGWLVHVLPKTLDDSVAGRLTRDFVARYGGDRSICSSLNSHFHSRGWCGNESDFCRKLREQAHSWLIDEGNANVIRWVENYIDQLSTTIEIAEIREERIY